MTDKNERPMWLQKDGKRSLYAAADVGDAKVNGWKEPEGTRSNGEPWNPEPDGIQSAQLDVLAEVNEATAERDQKVADKANKEAEEAMKASSAIEPPPPSADLRVEVVEPRKAEQAKPKK